MAVKFQQLSAWSVGPGVSQARETTERNPSLGNSLRTWAICKWGYGMAGNKDSAVLWGGSSYNRDATEEYNGVNWSTSNSFPIETPGSLGVGSQNAALSTAHNGIDGGSNHYGLIINNQNDTDTTIQACNFHANPASSSYQYAWEVSYEYNGSTWSNVATDIAASDGTRCANIEGGIVGSQTDAFVFGGSRRAHSSNASTDETTTDRNYNGTTWSVTGTTMANIRLSPQYFGTANSAVSSGGHAGTYYKHCISCSDVEIYNGTAWSSGPNLIGARSQGGGAGTSNDGIIFGGAYITECKQSWYCVPNLHYDGTSWSTSTGQMAHHRWGLQGRGASVGSALAGIGASRSHDTGGTMGVNCKTTPDWFSIQNSQCCYTIGSFSSGYAYGTIGNNQIEEYSVTTGGVQFGPRISGHKLSSVWDVGNYKSLYTREKKVHHGHSCGRLGTNASLANPSDTVAWYSIGVDCNYGKPTEGFVGGGLIDTGYRHGEVQLKGWSVGPDIDHGVGQRSLLRNYFTAGGNQNSMVVAGGYSCVGSYDHVQFNSSIFEGIDWAAGPNMIRAVSHAAGTGKNSCNMIVIGNKFGASTKSAVINNDNFEGICSEYNSKALYVTVNSYGSHFEHDSLNDYTGHTGGGIGSGAIDPVYAVQELNGITWSDGGALPMNVDANKGWARIKTSGQDYKETAGYAGYNYSESATYGKAHSFIGPKQATGHTDNALFVHEQRGNSSGYGYAQDGAAKYDGTSWSMVSSPIYVSLFAGPAMAGNPDSTIRVQGFPLSYGGLNPNPDQRTEEFDGNVWSQLPDQLKQRNYAGFSSKDACSGILWGGVGHIGHAVARSDEWDGTTWKASCAMIQHQPTYTHGSPDVAAGITRAMLGSSTGTQYELDAAGGDSGHHCSLTLHGAGSSNSSTAAMGFNIPFFRITAGANPAGSNSWSIPTTGNIQTTMWNDVSLKDAKNNLHLGSSTYCVISGNTSLYRHGTAWKPDNAILACTDIDTTMADSGCPMPIIGYGTTYVAGMNDARINTSWADKNQYIELNGTGSLESDYYKPIPKEFDDITYTGQSTSNAGFPRVWTTNAGLTSTRYDFDGTGTVDAGIVAGGQSGINAAAYSCTNVEKWDGIQWCSSQALDYASRKHAVVGTKCHTVVVGGYCPGNSPALSTNLQEKIQVQQNGSWDDSSAVLSQTRYDFSAVGKARGFIVWGGSTVGCTNTNDFHSITTSTEVMTDVTMAAGPNLPYAIACQGATGNSSNAVMSLGGSCTDAGEATNKTLCYNGTAWSSGPNQLIASFGQGGSGTQNSSVVWGAGDYSMSPSVAKNLTHEYDGTTFTTGPEMTDSNIFSTMGVQRCANYGRDGFGTTQNGAFSVSERKSAEYSDYIHNESNRFAATKESGGMSISMWVKMPIADSEYANVSGAWNKKIYLMANADVEVESPMIEDTQDIPRSGVRLLRYDNRIRLEWQNRSTSNLGSGNYVWGTDDNQDIISYFQTGTQTWSTTAWYNIVAVASFERSTESNLIFINGVGMPLAVSNQTTSQFEDVIYPENRSAKFRIGKFGGHAYKIDVANVMYYTRRLDGAEIINNYKTLLPRFNGAG